MSLNTVDWVFATVPLTITDEPIMAPAILKSLTDKMGLSSIAIDINQEIYNKIKVSKYSKNKFLDFSSTWNIGDLPPQEVIDLIDYSANRILQYNPKNIGLSLLTWMSQVFCYYLCSRLKQLSPNTPIVIGGSGMNPNIAAKDNSFVEEMINQYLIDYYITGDAEKSFVEFLNGNLTYPGINSSSWEQLTTLEDVPFPNFDDYKWEIYESPSIAIRDSNGCVRKCEFCDVIEHWTKFVFRNAEQTFQEMLHQIDRYGITKFSMKNSLTNGNLKEFKKWVEMISNYNENKTEDRQISWNGYFIIRPSSYHTDELWSLMKKSNARLFLGVESVIEHVRWSLGKKFKNEDIDYHLEMARNYKVPITILLMIGYPRETLEDFEFTKQWFKNRLHYAQNSVTNIDMSITAITPNTKLYKLTSSLNVETTEHPLIWVNKNQPEISFEQKKIMLQELEDICRPFYFNAPYKVRHDGYL